jgi:Brp/Blh family beta-carotene 15,15'-monooxygenase
LIDESTITWQVVIALIALAIGIPHGALDHLVTLPRSSVLKMTLFITVYVAIAIIAVWAILNWNIAGFIAVVAMSALHFGIGDAAFISEMDRSAIQSASPRIAQFSYAASAGLIPVVIPLTNQMSTSALNAVNPALLNWHGGYAEELNNLVTIFFLIALFIQIFSKRYRDGLDLSILFLLATLTPPLVAFAAYFGLWHAMRHTARLTLNLKSSKNFVREGNSAKAFLQAVIPGLPALVGTFIVSLALAAASPERLSDEFLWLSLVVVWALTVPHMMVTARLDKAAFK